MSIAEYIDHTNLKPTATHSDIVKLCDEARDYGFRGICINPCWVSVTEKELKDIEIVTVIGFPLGANCVETKIFEVEVATVNGATEIDVVWNLGAFKNRKYLQVVEELVKIVDIAMVPVKVIVEACYLDESELIKAYQIVKDSGADYIKTSTGFGPQGATHLAVATWKKLGDLKNSDNLKIKAAGGIRMYQSAKEFIRIGADVLGTSHGVLMVQEEKNQGNLLVKTRHFPDAYKGHQYHELDSEGLSGGQSIFTPKEE